MLLLVGSESSRADIQGFKDSPLCFKSRMFQQNVFEEGNWGQNWSLVPSVC